MNSLVLVYLFLYLAPHSSPTYADDVAPILSRNCAPCHRPGGGGPFPLLTFEDAKRHATQIAAVTRRRFMPPWLPDAEPGTFLEERRLSAEQIKTLGQWAEAHMPSGDLSHAPASNSTSLSSLSNDWELGRPDLVLKAATSFRTPASGPDVFWNFVFPTPPQSPRFVRAVEIHPDKSSLVHHANLLVDRIGSTLRLENTPGAGFPGMDLNLGRHPLDPESHFLFWKPGSKPYAEPDEFSWQLSPGNVLVLNTHLQPSGKVEEIAPSLGIYFTDKPPKQFPILVELQNDKALTIPPGTRDFIVEDRLRLPVPAQILAIYPHAHYLGTELEGFAILPDGTRRALVHIPNWDLNQQAVYRFREPPLLPQGTVIRMRYHYDNSAANIRNPHNPPQLVRAGNAATDEMGHLWLQLLPEGAGDRRRPIQEAVIRHRMEQEPADATWRVNLAALLLSRLDAQGAISELRKAIHLDPRRPEAYDMLGAALQNTGQLQPAIAQYRQALRLQPDFLNAHYNLALALMKMGAPREALDHLEVVAKAYPQNVRIQTQLQELRLRTANDPPSY